MFPRNSNLLVELGASALFFLGAAYGCGGEDESNAGNGDSSGNAGSGMGESGAPGRGGSAGTGGTTGAAGDPGAGGDPGTAGEPGTGGTAGAGGDTGTTLDPILTVDLSFTSLLPREQEFILVNALDDQGQNDTLTITSSDEDVATASVLGNTLVIAAGTALGEATISVESGSGLEKTVDVLVSDPRALKIGDDLLIAYVNEFDLLYNDNNSGASLNVSFWRPRVRNGFHAVGHIGRSDWADPTGNTAVPVVKALQAEALAIPTDFTQVWNDNNSGASMNGSFWRPVCPANYKALGHVGAENSWDKPPLDVIRCVRMDLVEVAAIGGQIWNDNNSGATLDFSAWSVVIPPGVPSIGTMPIAPGTFVGVGNWSQPSSDAAANMVRLDIPIVREVDLGNAFPKLESLLPPEETTPVQLGRAVLIPFTNVADPARTLGYKVDTSPFYRLDRDVYYRRLLHQYNSTDLEQPISHAVTTGVSMERSEEFSITTGISVTVSGGVNFGVGSAGSEVTVSLELGYTTSTTLGEFREETISKDVVVPPHSSAALWQLIHRFTLKRRNGNAWETVGTPWEIGVNSFVVDSYPD